MKYEFREKELDVIELTYTDKSGSKKTKEFKRTVDMAMKLEGCTARARLRMYAEMKKMGISRDDLVTKKDDGKGKITYDETALNEIEKKYIQEEQGRTAYDLMRKSLGNVDKLLSDLEFNETEAQLFVQKFILINTQGEAKCPTPTEGKK